jgi:hypothetical protein
LHFLKPRIKNIYKSKRKIATDTEC